MESQPIERPWHGSDGDAQRRCRLYSDPGEDSGRVEEQRQQVGDDHFKFVRCYIAPDPDRRFSDIRPVLIHEAELARRGWINNPTLAQIYTTESISQEQHDEQSIAWQTGRGAPVKRHRVRLDYGGETTVVDDE